MQNIEICYIVQIWRVSYQIAHRNNIFFGVRADRYIATLCRKNAFFGLRAEILLSTQVQVPGGYLDSRAGPFLGYVKKYWFFGEIFWTLCYRPSIHPQGVCSGFLDSLDQLLKEEGVESMGDVVVALLSAQSYLWKKSCCVCPSGTAVRPRSLPN